MSYDRFLTMDMGSSYGNAQPDTFAQHAFASMKRLLDAASM